MNGHEYARTHLTYLRNTLLKVLFKYPDPEKSHVLLTDASKYAWTCVLTHAHAHIIEGKERTILHPITYVSGLFQGSQLIWAPLTKETYANYMSVKKLPLYLDDADITVRSNHLHLKKLLEKKYSKFKC